MRALTDHLQIFGYRERMNDNSHATAIGVSPIDGRTARRDRNRTAVLDAVIELFSEGELNPGVHEVAGRSGVSLRSVYRYFEDVEDLVAAAIGRHIERSRHLFAMPDLGVGPKNERIARFCSRRVTLFSSVRPVYRASVVRAYNHPQLAAGIADRERELRRQTGAMFAPELDELSEDRAATIRRMLDSLSQFEALDYAYRVHSHDVDQTTGYLVDAFTEVLT